MAINGSINVSALFHDKDGTTAMKVVSLRSSNEYTTGRVAIITGTAGTAAVTVVHENVYRDASGQLVGFPEGSISRILFAWSSDTYRTLEEISGDGGGYFKIASALNIVASTYVPTDNVSLRLSATMAGNTGTYTIVVYDNST